jgi:Condensin complex subunit 2
MNDTGQKQLNAIKSSHQVYSFSYGWILTIAPEPERNSGYDADFFADNDTGGFGDVDDGETFADAREHFSPDAVDRTIVPDGSQSDEFGSLLRARRARPDYVNYAKTAKKVDVKKLKDNLWTKLDLSKVSLRDTVLINRLRWRNHRGSLRMSFVVLILYIRGRLCQI